ncbi:MAG: tetratricopeptide repeat protein, partial [Gemmataceae bacterium]
DWQEATTQWSRVDGMIRQQPALAPLQEYASSLEQAIQQGKEEQQTEREKSRAARDTHQRFLRAANRAMIHQLPNIGTRQHSNLQVVREEAPQALACYGVTLATRGRPDTDNPYLTEAERDSIVPGCYELLLAWAHATAHPVRDKGEDDFVQARKALEILDRAAQLGLDTRAYHMRRRTYLLITGDKEGAAGEFALARKMEAKTATDNYLVGAELYATVPALAEPARTQAHRQAIQHLQRAVDLRPDHYWANFELGRIYLHAGRLDAGVARLTACIQQSDFAWAYSLRAHANATLNLYDAAELDFASAEKQGDDEVRYGVLVNRGVMYFQRGEQAQADTKQVQHWLDRARREYERAIALAPDQYQAYVNLARLWQFQGQLDLALENLDRAIELRGSDSSLLRTRALLQLKRRQEDAALDDLERAVATAPALKSTNLASDHLERGRILYRKRRYQDALEAFETAQRMHPEEFPSAHRLRAEALLELGRHSEALLAINRYLTRGGEADHDAYLTRGLIRTKLSRFREAIDDFTLALAAPLAKVTEGQADKIRAQTFSYRGWAYLLLNAVEVAEGDFDQAVKLDSQNGDAYSGRGNARVKQGKHEEALADIETSLRLGPASSRLSYNAARTYALAVDAVSKNAAFDRQKLSQAQFYQSRAIDLLRESLDQVPAAERAIYWKDFIDTDPALQAVRRSPRFAQLQATLR